MRRHHRRVGIRTPFLGEHADDTAKGEHNFRALTHASPTDDRRANI